MVMFLGAVLSKQALAEPNVILITFDGVRPQEFFDPVNLPYFWSKLADEGVVFGKKEVGSQMTVSNTANISLPGYMSIMAGATTPCVTNHCARTSDETLGERLVRELKLKREQVASISSWKKIPLAFESREGTTFTNGGFDALNDGAEDDAELEAINAAQVSDIPTWQENRFDKYTYAHAMRYLKRHRPRFLYISINDTDDWAHNGDYPRYLESMRVYDGWLREIVETLESMGGYGKETTILLSTDHGRGDGENWKHHSSTLPESRDIFLYARGPRTATTGIVQGGPAYSHSDIRPTIEALFGLNPLSCESCGKPITSITNRQ